MSRYSSSMSDKEIERVLAAIEVLAYQRDPGECYVIPMMCEKCGGVYEEELGEAWARIDGRKSLVCLSCDDEASVPAFSQITIEIGWE